MERQHVPGPGRVWAECRERFRHARLRGEVEAYADGQLTGAHRMRVAAHIACCWACSGRLQLLRLVKASLRASPHRTPPTLASARVRRFARHLSTPPGQDRPRH
ncbi:zf-HC2 domain-containing protein [Streptomyces sp. P01-B04]|uniref:anti-sigma factor family protein n=1 Tax=Streptomyces poriferorum TaxID=2798799 RepID=UPI001C618051|nr:zf-HC2 domain-containing protein [Streptomyces poriferorum]MBW5257879.1 zf-HC2 domain-containing protein [Streptomyces poriferorum]